MEWIMICSFSLVMLLVLVIFYKLGKKIIIQDAAEMGWKVIKIKFNWWNSIVDYQDENGVPHTTHCRADVYEVKWEEDTDGLFLEQKTYKVKTRIRKIISIVCGLCFLYLFVGYQYEQISWNVFRYSFVKNGNTIKTDNRIAIGLESILRGEEAQKMINTLYPDHEPPQKNKEFVIIKLKFKNISKNSAEEVSFSNLSANRWDSNFELSALTTLPDYRDPLILAKGETTFNSFHGEVAINDPIQILHLSFYLYEFGYESKELPLSNNPFRGENFSPLMYWFYALFIVPNALLNRWYLLLKSKKTKGLILLPICIILVSMITILISQKTEYTADWFLNFFMVALFTITWWNIILLASTKPEPDTSAQRFS
jgi:hypothetical protein